MPDIWVNLTTMLRSRNVIKKNSAAGVLSVVALNSDTDMTSFPNYEYMKFDDVNRRYIMWLNG